MKSSQLNVPLQERVGAKGDALSSLLPLKGRAECTGNRNPSNSFVWRGAS